MQTGKTLTAGVIRFLAAAAVLVLFTAAGGIIMAKILSMVSSPFVHSVILFIDCDLSCEYNLAE